MKRLIKGVGAGIICGVVVVGGVMGYWAVGKKLEVEVGVASYGGGEEGFLTVEPETGERVQLRVLGCDLREDVAAERRMLELLEAAREEAGVGRLAAEAQVTRVARGHSWDMWRREYFSHFSPEGEGAAQRLETGGVSFGLAGENLAKAASVEAAFRGLMESEGHRRNILEPRFTRVGVGAINGGKCGILLVQNFVD